MGLSGRPAGHPGRQICRARRAAGRLGLTIRPIPRTGSERRGQRIGRDSSSLCIDQPSCLECTEQRWSRARLHGDEPHPAGETSGDSTNESATPTATSTVSRGRLVRARVRPNPAQEVSRAGRMRVLPARPTEKRIQDLPSGRPRSARRPPRPLRGPVAIRLYRYRLHSPGDATMARTSESRRAGREAVAYPFSWILISRLPRRDMAQNRKLHKSRFSFRSIGCVGCYSDLPVILIYHRESSCLRQSKAWRKGALSVSKYSSWMAAQESLRMQQSRPLGPRHSRRSDAYHPRSLGAARYRQTME